MGDGASPSDDGFLMTSGLKNASKCRSCQKTLDVGTPAWFNKEGEPGRKVRCQECHRAQFGDAPPPEEGAKNELLETKKKKPKRLQPKVTAACAVSRVGRAALPRSAGQRSLVAVLQPS